MFDKALLFYFATIFLRNSTQKLSLVTCHELIQSWTRYNLFVLLYSKCTLKSQNRGLGMKFFHVGIYSCDNKTNATIILYVYYI